MGILRVVNKDIEIGHMDQGTFDELIQWDESASDNVFISCGWSPAVDISGADRDYYVAVRWGILDEQLGDPDLEDWSPNMQEILKALNEKREAVGDGMLVWATL